MTQNNTAMVRVTDPETGISKDMVGTPLLKDAIAMLVMGGNKPPHLVELEKLNVDDPESLLATYAAVKHHKLTEAHDSVLELCGAVIWWSGPFTSRTKVDEFGDALTEAGYFTVLLKSTETDSLEIKMGKQIVDFRFNRVYRISGKKVAETALAIMDKRGWYDWKEPIKVAVLGNQEDGFSLLPLSDRIMGMQVAHKER